MTLRIYLYLAYKTMNQSEAINTVVDRLKNCESVLFITGAGLSADSGLPTYRGVGGMYEVDGTEDGLPIEQLLSPGMLNSRPEVTWKYLAQIADACRGATFNRGHEVIANFEKSVPRCWVLTQNVDGFHKAAGSRNVIDIHGDMHELICTNCSWQKTLDHLDEFSMPPQCPQCQQIARPRVVLFGEMLPFEKVDIMQEELERGFDVIISIGTSALFPYISGPVEFASRTSTFTVEINPGTTEISNVVDVHLKIGAAAALDEIWRMFNAS